MIMNSVLKEDHKRSLRNCQLVNVLPVSRFHFLWCSTVGFKIVLLHNIANSHYWKKNDNVDKKWSLWLISQTFSKYLIVDSQTDSYIVKYFDVLKH